MAVDLEDIINDLQGEAEDQLSSALDALVTAVHAGIKATATLSVGEVFDAIESESDDDSDDDTDADAWADTEVTDDPDGDEETTWSAREVWDLVQAAYAAGIQCHRERVAATVGGVRNLGVHAPAVASEPSVTVA